LFRNLSCLQGNLSTVQVDRNGVNHFFNLLVPETGPAGRAKLIV